MKKQKSPFAAATHWRIEKHVATLYAGETPLLVLTEEGKQTTFSYNGSSYNVKSKGLWNPQVVVTKNETEVAVLHRFLFKSKAELSFQNEVRYHCKVKNNPLVTFVFYDLKENKVLHYKIDAKLKPMSVVKIFDESLPEHELAMLLVVGYYTFQHIVKETEAADLITIVAAAG